MRNLKHCSNSFCIIGKNSYAWGLRLRMSNWLNLFTTSVVIFINILFLTYYFLMFSTVDLFAVVYKGISLGAIALLATAATYFAVIVIDSTKPWLEHTNPNIYKRPLISLYYWRNWWEIIFLCQYCIFFLENIHDATHNLDWFSACYWDLTAQMDFCT